MDRRPCLGKIIIFASYDFLKVNKLFETSKVCQVLISSKFLNRVHLELLACNKHPHHYHISTYQLIPAKTIIYSFKKLLKEIIFWPIMNYFPRRSALKDCLNLKVWNFIFLYLEKLDDCWRRARLCRAQKLFNQEIVKFRNIFVWFKVENNRDVYCLPTFIERLEQRFINLPELKENRICHKP